MFFNDLQKYTLINCSDHEVEDFSKKLASLLIIGKNFDKNVLLKKITRFNADLFGGDTNNVVNWKSVIRSNIKINELSFDVLNDYAQELSKTLKESGFKFNKSKILFEISRSLNFTGSQALKSKPKSILPEFKKFKLQKSGQDLIEIITFNNVIIDVQVSGFNAFAGSFASQDPEDPSTLLYYTQHFSHYQTPNVKTIATDALERYSLKYDIKSVEDVDLDYIDGFMEVINGKKANQQRLEDSIEYRFGSSVANSNLRLLKGIHKSLSVNPVSL